MRLKKSEQNHIEAKGKLFSRALAAASMSVRQNNKLVGLDKIRDPIAYRAALKVTGFELDFDGVNLPENAGESLLETQEIVDAAFKEAVEAAYSAQKTA